MSDEQETQSSFLTDHTGKPSSMRLMSVTALVASLIFTVMVLRKDGDPHEFEVYIVFGYLLAAFAPKALQKVAESYFDMPAPGE